MHPLACNSKKFTLGIKYKVWFTSLVSFPWKGNGIYKDPYNEKVRIRTLIKFILLSYIGFLVYYRLRDITIIQKRLFDFVCKCQDVWKFKLITPWIWARTFNSFLSTGNWVLFLIRYAFAFKCILTSPDKECYLKTKN